VRVPLGALAVAVLLAMAGCAGPAAGSPRAPASANPVPSATREPAEDAGGACLLLSFEQVDTVLGVAFGAMPDLLRVGEKGDHLRVRVRKRSSSNGAWRSMPAF